MIKKTEVEVVNSRNYKGFTAFDILDHTKDGAETQHLEIILSRAGGEISINIVAYSPETSTSGQSYALESDIVTVNENGFSSLPRRPIFNKGTKSSPQGHNVRSKSNKNLTTKYSNPNSKFPEVCESTEVTVKGTW